MIDISLRATVLTAALLLGSCLFAGESAPAATVLNKNAEITGLPKLFTDLESPDAAVKKPAAMALLNGLEEQIKLARKPHAKKLHSDLSSTDANAQESAVATVASVITDLKKVNPKVYGEAIGTLNAPDAAQREAARASLVGLIDSVIEANVVDKYIEDLASPDAAAAAEANKRLIALGADAASALAHALDDERLQVKKSASDILKAMGPAARDAAGDLSFMLDSEDKGTRRLAAAVLENLGPDAVDAVDDLVNYLSSDEKPVRRTAAGILKKIGAPGWARMDPKDSDSATSDLVDLLTDDDKNIRNLSAEILLSLGAAAKSGSDALVAVIQDANNDPDSRERAAQVLGSIGPDAKAAIPLLAKLPDDNAGVREAVTAAIKKMEGGK